MSFKQINCLLIKIKFSTFIGSSLILKVFNLQKKVNFLNLYFNSNIYSLNSLLFKNTNHQFHC